MMKKKNIGALFNCKCDPLIKRHKCYNFKSIFPHPPLKAQRWSSCSLNAEEHQQDLNSPHPNAKGPLEPKHSKGNLWGRENVQMENRTKPRVIWVKNVLAFAVEWRKRNSIRSNTWPVVSPLTRNPAAIDQILPASSGGTYSQCADNPLGRAHPTSGPWACPLLQILFNTHFPLGSLVSFFFFFL